MASMVERDEWKAFSDVMAVLAALCLALVGLVFAFAGKDSVIAFHGAVLFGASGLAGLYVLTTMVERKEPEDETGYADGVIRAGVIATVVWGLVGFLVGDLIAWQLAFPVLNFDLPWTSFRPLAAAAHLGRDLRLRRQRADRDLLLCRAAHLPRAARREVVALVRVLGLSALHRARRHRLSARRHPVQGICRIIVKAPDGLERAALTDMVVFDKTGTLTLGRPELLDADAIPDSVLQTAAGVAAASRHPFARAIVAAAETRLKIVATPDGVVETPGYVSSARRRRVPSGLAPRSGAG